MSNINPVLLTVIFSCVASILATILMAGRGGVFVNLIVAVFASVFGQLFFSWMDWTFYKPVYDALAAAAFGGIVTLGVGLFVGK